MAYQHIEPKVGAQAFGDVSTTAKHGLGETAKGRDSSLFDADFIYAKASAAITQYMTVWIKSTKHAAAITDTLSKTGGLPAFAQVAFAADEYGWFLRQGNCQVLSNNDADKDLALYVMASAGVLNTTTTSVMIQGITLTSSATATVSAVTAVANYPSVVRAVTLGAV